MQADSYDERSVMTYVGELHKRLKAHAGGAVGEDDAEGHVEFDM